ncbi:MAG: hypothetical protein KGL12_02320 [Rhodospirillales bacterium]|nr:hypothetical protein [Rhodospirillales bacterium]
MFRILAATADVSLTDRMITALDGLAVVVRVDPNPASVRDSVASVRPDLVALEMDGRAALAATTLGLIRELVDADPARPVIAIGGEANATLVLQAVRAGARDFIDRDSGSETLRGQIGGQLSRAARGAPQPSGKLTVITSGQPNDGEAQFAINYAVLRARSAADVLLIDFGLPASEAGPSLDLDPTYTIRDAIQDSIRLDRTLLATALSRHGASGLSILPLATGPGAVGDLNTGSILSLLATLRTIFAEVVVNLAGHRHPALVGELFGNASAFFLLTRQSLPSLKACRDLLAPLPLTADTGGRLILAVADFDATITMTTQQISSTLGVSRIVKLPPAHAALSNAINKGVPLVLDQPRHPYSRALAGLAGATARPGAIDTASHASPVSRLPFLHRFFGHPASRHA